MTAGGGLIQPCTAAYLLRCREVNCSMGTLALLTLVNVICCPPGLAAKGLGLCNNPRSAGEGPLAKKKQWTKHAKETNQTPIQGGRTLCSVCGDALYFCQLRNRR